MATYIISPPPKKKGGGAKAKARTVPLADKVMGIVSWDSEGCILVDFLLKGETINMVHYFQML
jgi:hypothetical protein